MVETQILWNRGSTPQLVPIHVSLSLKVASCPLATDRTFKQDYRGERCIQEQHTDTDCELLGLERHDSAAKHFCCSDRTQGLFPALTGQLMPAYNFISSGLDALF